MVVPGKIAEIPSRLQRKTGFTPGLTIFYYYDNFCINRNYRIMKTMSPVERQLALHWGETGAGRSVVKPAAPGGGNPALPAFPGPGGWVLYDGACGLCAGTAVRFAGTLRRAGFAAEPLQTPWVGELLGYPAGSIPDEMIVLTADGRALAGVDGILEILRRLWWTWPLYAAGHVPGIHLLCELAYRQVAKHRHCANGICAVRRKRRRGTASFYEIP